MWRGRKGRMMTGTLGAKMPSEIAVQDAAAAAVVEVPDSREVDELEVALKPLI